MTINGTVTNYEISNFGRVFSIERFALFNGTPSLVKRKLLQPISNGLGYLQCGFSVNGKTFRRYIHVLVAENFINKPRSLEKLEVNHIDRNKSNNCCLNLEFVTHKENAIHWAKEKYPIENRLWYLSKLSAERIKNERLLLLETRLKSLSESKIDITARGSLTPIAKLWGVSEQHAGRIIKKLKLK